MTILWLDDLRDPYLDLEKKVPHKENAEIIWVKNYNEFTERIKKYGLPDVISFDHDLAEEHYTPEEYWNDYYASKKYQESQDYVEKTGLDCAKWLIKYCLNNDLELPEYYVHSANPVGRDKIKLKLDKFRIIDNDDYREAKKLGLTDLDRWEDDVDHHPMSERIVRFMADHDFQDYNDSMCIKMGGDGDNGEHLMYLMDAYFEMIDENGKEKN